MNLLERATAIGIENLMHCDEAEKLCDLACNCDVLEIGSYKGFSCWAMAITAKSVTCVDTFRANSAGQTQMPEQTTLADFRAAVARYSNVQAIPVSSQEAAELREMTGRMFDMIFLDAMHTYENVRDDIHRWWAHLKSGGVLVLHDYKHWDFPDVERAADEIFGPAPEGTTLVTLRWIAKP